MFPCRLRHVAFVKHGMNFKDRKDIEIDPIIAPSKSEGPLSRCLWVDIRRSF